MQRLIDADKFAEALKSVALRQKYDKLFSDNLLSVADIFDAIIADLKGTALNGYEYCPTVLTIPDNPTNGDMIKALFPNIKFNEKWKATRHFELQSEQGHIEITGIATSDWWNSPFEPQKSEVEDGNVD